MLRFPEILNQSIHIWLAADVLDPRHPCMPIHVAVLGGAGEMDGIIFILILPDRLIGCAAKFELVTVKRIRLVEDPYQFRQHHIVEGTPLHRAAAGFRTPVHFEGGLK
jgi:hypothetical protein